MNIANMKKDEIIKRSNFRCKHGHNGLAHPKCYDTETGGGERIGYLDIEASNLNADFGFVLSYCIKVDGGEVIKNLITPDEIHSGEFDKRLMIELCEHLRQFDRIVTYYGARFDIPFVRTRCIYHKIDFPLYKEVKHTDVYDIAKRKLNLHSKRLGVICDFFGIPAKGHGMKPAVWNRCCAGHLPSLKYVLVHNIEDVESLETLYHRIRDFAKINDTSM